MKKLIVIIPFLLLAAFADAQSRKNPPDPPLQNDTTIHVKEHEPPMQNDTTATTDARVAVTNTDTTIYEKVEQMPAPAYNISAYIMKNTKYPQGAKEAHKEGIAYVSFVVEPDGSLTNILIARSAGMPSLDREALRVITSMPKWNPGMQGGRPVRVKMTEPVKFKLY